MRKILFCDIDGTILDGNHPLHPDNFKSMWEWQQKGNLITLCTGRNLFECQNIIQLLDIPYDYLILNNGAHILDHDHTLYEKTIDRDIGIEILDMITKYQGMWSYFCDGKHSYAYKDGITYQHIGIDNMKIDEDFYELYHQAPAFQIICFNQDDHGFDQSQEIINEIQYLHHIIEIHKNQYYVDIVRTGCSKGTGIQTLMKMLDNKYKVYAIGDSYNDICMFKVADVSATFDYSDQIVKDHADVIVSYLYQLTRGKL